MRNIIEYISRSVRHTAGKKHALTHVATTTVMAACAMAVMLTTACETEERYSDRPCYFVFRADYHPTHILSRVLSNPGMFITVTAEKRLGIPHILTTAPFTLSNEDKDIALTTEIENRYNYTFAANNSLIIGCSVTNEGRAYDRQCPYCLRNSSTNNFPLTWTEGGNGQTVTCAKCSRTYNLNYGTSTDGQRLVEYRVRFDGTAIVVSN